MSVYLLYVYFIYAYSFYTHSNLLKNFSTSKESPPRKSGTWGQERRLQFIDFRLRWEGRINRTDLTDFFGISVPQASVDIGKYLDIAPQNLAYDHSTRTYLATVGFRPCFQRSSARRYLSELLATKAGVIEADTSFSRFPPEIDSAPSPWRTVDETTVESMVRAIREQKAVRVHYQSMTSSDDATRLLSPHALGHDGFRWHARAYCHKKNRFSDFVLARLLSIEGFEPSNVDPSSDVQWHTNLKLVLAPHPELPLAKRRVVELDYGMVNGEVHMACRQAFLFYTLRRLGLQSNVAADPIAQQIVLANREVIQPYIDALSNTG